MDVFVTGGQGMLGFDIEQEIAKHVVPIGGTWKPSRREVDLVDAAALRRAAEGKSIDVILHCAAWTDVDGCETDPERAERDNVIATRNVAALAAERRALLLHVSTDYVFSGEATEPIPPHAPTGPVEKLSVYGRTKLQAEHEVTASGAPFLIVRTSWLVGLSRWNFVEAIRQRAFRGERLRVVTDQTGTPTYTFDLAPALLRLAALWRKEGHASRVLHVTNQGHCTRFEQAREILASEGLDLAILTAIKSEEDKRPARRPKYSVLDNSAANKILAKLGWKLPSWRDSLKVYLRLRSQPAV